MVEIVKSIPHGSKVLDYGCGNGRACSLFQPDRYLGVDPSENLIDIARNKYPEYSFELIKPGKIPLDVFDAAICLSVIHHLPSKETQSELIRSLKSALKPESIVIVTAWNLREYKISDDSLVHLPFRDNKHVIDRALYKFDPEELEGLLSDHGLEIIKSSIQPRNRGKYSNIEIIAKLAT